MAAYVLNEMNYVDGGSVIKKRTWTDPDSGNTWDTFDTIGAARDPNVPSGTVVDDNFAYGDSSNAFGFTQPESNSAPESSPGTQTPPGGAFPTVTTDRTRGLNQPTSTTYAAPQNAGGSRVPGGNPFNPQPGTVDPSLEAQSRNLFLYNPDQPGQAFQNVLRGMGYNPGLNNPLTNMLQRFAPGLGAAFNIGGAASGAAASPDIGGDFGSFIRKNLGGGLQNTLASASAQLPAALDAIKNQATNQTMTPNPWIANLQSILEAGGGQGLAGVLSSLSAPFMSPRMAQANQNAILGGLSQGQYNYGNSSEFADPNSYWLQYLFGR